MSRVGSAPVKIPQNVNCHLVGEILKAKGKLGELSIVVPEGIFLDISESLLNISSVSKDKKTRMVWGTFRSQLSNLVQGVDVGFSQILEINGVGYRASVQGSDLVLALGYSHEVRYAIPQGIEIKCEKPTEVRVFGVDKQKVGQVASEIRGFRPPEPYKGKGVKYLKEKILRKIGKKK